MEQCRIFLWHHMNVNKIICFDWFNRFMSYNLFCPKCDFLAYFKKKAEEKNTKWENVYKYFERFVEVKCTFGEIDVDLCVRFMEYLQTTPQIHRTEKKLHTNTVGYWSTFRAVLHTAYQNTLCK